MPIVARLTNIYFIQAIHGGPVKIGKSNDPKSRLSGIQTGNPNEVRIVKLIKNVSPKVERDLHEKFCDYRIRGEWFSEDVLNGIDTVVESKGKCKAKAKDSFKKRSEDAAKQMYLNALHRYEGFYNGKEFIKKKDGGWLPHNPKTGCEQIEMLCSPAVVDRDELIRTNNALVMQRAWGWL